MKGTTQASGATTRAANLLGGTGAFFRPFEFETFARQESILIVLNLAVLASIVVAHILFGPAIGTPPPLIFAVIAGRFLMQSVELIWLSTRSEPLAPILTTVYANFSIWMNIGFAFCLSLLGGYYGLPDSHYSELMAIPLLAAAFRYSLVGVGLVFGTVASLTFAEVSFYFSQNPPLEVMEFFEAANTVLIYLVVLLVVFVLVRQLRKDQLKLRQSLADLEQTRDQLVEEEKLAAVGRLSSSIAHEIRNPVAMIMSSVALAGRKKSDLVEREELCDIVFREAGRLEKLTNDFLTYARMKPPQRKVTSIRTTLDYVASVVRAQAEERQVTLVVDCPEQITARLDEFQIHQALLNLVVNALDASPKGGAVLLRGFSISDTVCIEVENQGAPIASDVLSKIFEPFFTTKPAGTGLGLAISRNVLVSHRGEVHLSANEPDRVCFRLSLPEKQNGQEEPIASDSEERSPVQARQASTHYAATPRPDRRPGRTSLRGNKKQE